MAKNTPEKMYTVQEIAALWGIYRKTVTKLFRKEPGVLTIPLHRGDGTKHERYTLRIPESVFQRVRKQITNS